VLNKARNEFLTEELIEDVTEEWRAAGEAKDDYRIQRALSYMHPFARKWMSASVRNTLNHLKPQNARDEYLKLLGISPYLPICNWCSTTPTRRVEDHVVTCTYKYMNRRVGIKAQKGVQFALSHLEIVEEGEPALENSIHFTPTDEDDHTSYLADMKTTHLGREVLVDVRYTGTFMQTQAQRKMTNLQAETPTVEMLKKEKERRYAKRHTITEGAMVFFCIDSCGAWNKDMVKHFEEARAEMSKRRSRIQEISTFNIHPERKKQVWRWSLEQVSLAICRATDEFFMVAREGRLPNGLNKAQAEERTRKNKLLKDSRERETKTEELESRRMVSTT